MTVFCKTNNNIFNEVYNDGLKTKDSMEVISDTPEYVYYKNGRPNMVSVENWMKPKHVQNPEETKEQLPEAPKENKENPEEPKEQHPEEPNEKLEEGPNEKLPEEPAGKLSEEPTAQLQDTVNPEVDPNAYSWYNPAGWFGAAPETPETEVEKENVEAEK